MVSTCIFFIFESRVLFIADALLIFVFKAKKYKKFIFQQEKLKEKNAMSKAQKPKGASSNTTIGGIIVAIIAALLYYMGGGTPKTDKPTTDKPVTDKEETTTAFIKLKDYLPTSTTGVLLKHEYYTISYDEKSKQAEWVAYELTRKEVLDGSKGSVERESTFKPDPELIKLDPDNTDKVVTTKDYVRTGYDRGHLVPAQDMAFSEESMRETFFMTNVSPQDKDFNRGKWKQLEGEVRGWAAKYDHVYVVCGPVLTKRAKERFPAEKNNVAVPHSFYKIILDYKDEHPKAIAFWLRNEKTDFPLSGFVVTIDKIEELTGIDFFKELPDDIEDRLESQADLNDWGLTQDAYSATLEDNEKATSKIDEATQKKIMEYLEAE